MMTITYSTATFYVNFVKVENLIAPFDAYTVNEIALLSQILILNIQRLVYKLLVTQNYN